MPDLHLEDGLVLRLLHGEVAGPAQAEAREHLARCADCRQRVEAARRAEEELQASLQAVDHPTPRVSAESIVARARATSWRTVRWAALVLLALGLAGAAYAAPGSPLRGWIRAAVAWMRGRPEQPSTVAPPWPAPEPAPAGVAVSPGERLLILFTSPQTGAEALVSLTDGADVVVRAPEGAATFTSRVDRLTIDNRGAPARFEIEIPRAAPRVEIRVAGVRFLLKEGSRITAERSSAASAPYRFPLNP